MVSISRTRDPGRWRCRLGVSAATGAELLAELSTRPESSRRLPGTQAAARGDRAASAERLPRGDGCVSVSERTEGHHCTPVARALAPRSQLGGARYAHLC